MLIYKISWCGPQDKLESTGEDPLLDRGAASYTNEFEDAKRYPMPPPPILGTRNWIICLLVSIALCIVATKIAFPTSVPVYASILVTLMSLVMCLMGIQALGETDFILAGAKISVLFFAVAIVQSANSNAVIITLVAGTITECATAQAGTTFRAESFLPSVWKPCSPTG
ncbi:hypothetical protein G7Y89_g14605 [Cudoniella acicularis]|uniref:Uncharacterized protein n=1 Tax=Cudoniella acicularis TaxID=354080 RepID=A0A8H4R0M0_9HELO|nr:hypothetical protein G7Y89_g14605 [Cudoniella acicularis]